MISSLLEGMDRVLPKGRMKRLAYDKAADDQKIHEMLKYHHVRPLIEIRPIWKDKNDLGTFATTR
jgi:hypothetical protein